MCTIHCWPWKWIGWNGRHGIIRGTHNDCIRRPNQLRGTQRTGQLRRKRIEDTMKGIGNTYGINGQRQRYHMYLTEGIIWNHSTKTAEEMAARRQTWIIQTKIDQLRNIWIVDYCADSLLNLCVVCLFGFSSVNMSNNMCASAWWQLRPKSICSLFHIIPSVGYLWYRCLCPLIAYVFSIPFIVSSILFLCSLWMSCPLRPY